MTSQMALKYSALRFWYWRLESRLDSAEYRQWLVEVNSLVGVLPGVNTQQGLELTDNGVLVLRNC